MGSWLGYREISVGVQKITVIRGTTHNFVGMDIEFIGDGAFAIMMKEYLKESIAAFVDEITKKVKTLAKVVFSQMMIEKIRRHKMKEW